jgi:type I restriction enzyme S subunit
VLTFKYGKSLPGPVRKPGSVAVYGSNGLVGYHDKALVNGPAIIVGRKGSIGEVHFSVEPCWPIDTTYFIDDFGDHSPEFWLWYLRHLQLGSLNRATAIPGLNRDDAYKSIVLVPSAKDQIRIVQKLDSLLNRSKSAREELAHIPRLAERYKDAILSAAFRGELTFDWRQSHAHKVTGAQLLEELRTSRAKCRSKIKGKPSTSPPAALHDLPAGWTWCSVDVLASVVSDGVHKKPTYVNEGVPFLTVRNLTAGCGISFGGCRFVSQADHEEFIKRTHPERGDLLISKDGTLGVVRAVRTDAVFSIFVSVALVKPVDRSMTDYLELALSSPQVQEQMVGVGTGLQHIHLTDLRRDHIPIAPANERTEIVRRVRNAFAYIEHLATETSRATNLIDRLDQATLAKAFKGELIPHVTVQREKPAKLKERA